MRKLNICDGCKSFPSHQMLLVFSKYYIVPWACGRWSLFHCNCASLALSSAKNCARRLGAVISLSSSYLDVGRAPAPEGCQVEGGDDVSPFGSHPCRWILYRMIRSSCRSCPISPSSVCRDRLHTFKVLLTEVTAVSPVFVC